MKYRSNGDSEPCLLLVPVADGAINIIAINKHAIDRRVINSNAINRRAINSASINNSVVLKITLMCY